MVTVGALFLELSLAISVPYCILTPTRLYITCERRCLFVLFRQWSKFFAENFLKILQDLLFLLMVAGKPQKVRATWLFYFGGHSSWLHSTMQSITTPPHKKKDPRPNVFDKKHNYLTLR